LRFELESTKLNFDQSPIVQSIIKNKIFSRVKKRIAEDGLLTTASLAVDLARRKIDHAFFYRKRLDGYLRNSQSAIEAGLSVQDLKQTTLAYVESMRVKESGPYGRYRYCGSQGAPLLYASVYAALTRSMYGDLDTLSAEDRQEWISYILSFQGKDGLFRDPEVDCELANTVFWWGWMHLTFHVVSAIAVLGGVCEKGFLCIDSLRSRPDIQAWFLERRIRKLPSPDIEAHSPLYLITFLQYSRDFLGISCSNEAINEIISLLNDQIDPVTGCWGTEGRENDIIYINEGVKIGYHFWIFYFYDRLSIPYADKVVDSLLQTQNVMGGFDVSLNSSACDDIDSIDPLCRLLVQNDYRKKAIENSLRRAVPWVLANRNLDGGFVFKRDEPFQYGHIKMRSGRNESNMFATWFRSLSLAYVGKALPDHFLAKHDWHLPRAPGLQFWP
jgi:prenyltransferase beta subunit